MAQETFFSYKGYRYLILNLFLLAALILGYIFNDPIGGRNGGTVLGYAYGILAALGIFWLMYYGIRKRSYHSKFTTLKGTLSAHVWLGISLILIVPLHSGFSFGINVHTLAYVLMLIVIVSGIYGAIAYNKLASSIPSHRGAGTVKKHLEQIALINNEIEDLISNKSDRFVELKQKADINYEPSLKSAISSKKIQLIDRTQLASSLQNVPAEEQEAALKLIALIDKKIELIAELQKEVSVMTKLRFWLFLHLPVSFALLAALLIHIFVVFYYW